MIYQPSYPKPYLSDIDANKPATFECYINAEGGTQIVRYNLTILDLIGNQVFSTGITQLQYPLYSNDIFSVTIPNTQTINGNDYVWTIQLFENNPNIWVTYGTVQDAPTDGVPKENTATQVYIRGAYLVKSGMYLRILNESRKISNYDSKTGLATLETGFTFVPTKGIVYNVYSDNIISDEIFFQARSTPVINVNTIPQLIESKDYTFVGSYSQSENVDWKNYQWVLYDEFANEIDRSDIITSGEIKFYYDGFLNGERYGVNLIVENQDGIILQTDIVYFDVKYLEPEITNLPIGKLNCNVNAIEISWSPPLINSGEVDPVVEDESLAWEIVKNQPFQGGSSVRIKEPYNLYWYIGSENNKINVPYESTTYINWKAENLGFDGLIYEQLGEYVELLAITSTPPAECFVGDKYFSTKDNKIYTCVAMNTWSQTGDYPTNENLYHLQTAWFGVNHVLWDEELNRWTDATNIPLPYYKVGFSKGRFYYEIQNLDGLKTGEVIIRDISDLWLLQTEIHDPAQAYGWLDDSIWEDDLFWTETTDSVLKDVWFKITLLPTGIQVHVNPIQ